MVISDIQLYELLKVRIGDKEADAFVQLLEHKVDKKFQDFEKIYKQDISSLKEYMQKMFATKEDLAQLEIKLTRAIYIVGLVQYLAMLASLIAIIKFLL